MYTSKYRKNRKHEPTTKLKQHMCMDKGYDYLEVLNYATI